jgi:hypothetical protein
VIYRTGGVEVSVSFLFSGLFSALDFILRISRTFSDSWQYGQSTLQLELDELSIEPVIDSIKSPFVLNIRCIGSVSADIRDIRNRTLEHPKMYKARTIRVPQHRGICHRPLPIRPNRSGCTPANCSSPFAFCTRCVFCSFANRSRSSSSFLFFSFSFVLRVLDLPPPPALDRSIDQHKRKKTSTLSGGRLT